MPGRWRGRGGFNAGGALQPLAKKSVLQSSPHGRTGIFFLGRIPTLARAWQAGGFYAGQVARPGFYAGSWGIGKKKRNPDLGAGEWRFRGLAWTHIAHIAHIARSPGTVGVQRLGVHAAPCRSKSGCPRCPQWEVELVRPAFDLALRRIQSLKRCVQACGCKIVTPRYAPQFGSRLHFKRCQALPKETPFPFFSGTPFFGTPCFFCFVLALQRLLA